MPVTQAKVLEVQRLIKLGDLSFRKIARMVGIGRGTVGQIASGKRLAWPDRVRAADNRAYRHAGPIARCPECGGRVYIPCLLCHVRALKRIDRRGS
jgi:hypothetical protein